MPTTTIQEGVAGAVVPDTYLDSNNDITNYGSVNVIHVGWLTGKITAARRTILEFDLAAAGIPSDAVVSSTSLVLSCAAAAASAEAVRAYRLTRADWVENEATWRLYKVGIGTDWTNPGGDYDSGTYVAGTLPTVTGDWTLSDSGLVTLVKDALQNQSGILRLLIKRTTEASTSADALFRSGEYTTVADRPELSVTYTTGIAALRRRIEGY